MLVLLLSCYHRFVLFTHLYYFYIGRYRNVTTATSHRMPTKTIRCLLVGVLITIWLRHVRSQGKLVEIENLTFPISINNHNYLNNWMKYKDVSGNYKCVVNIY